MRSAQKTRSPSLRTTSIPHIKSREAGTSKAVVFDASSATLLCETENTTRRSREHALSDTPAQKNNKNLFRRVYERKCVFIPGTLKGTT